MSGEPSILVHDDAEAAARAAALAIAGALIEGVAARGRADWATTGGSTPVGIYRALAAGPLREAVPWASVHVWWGDDRFVRRDDPLSNVGPVDRELLPRVAMPAANVHAMPMDRAIADGSGAEWVASAYEAELRGAGLPIAESGLPVFDVTLVGIGGDGHVLSVFPGSHLFAGSAWVSAVPAPTHIEPRVARVSLHPWTLLVARYPIVVAHGAGKAAMLASVLGPERDLRQWPAQVARREGAFWFLDRAAASELPE